VGLHHGAIFLPRRFDWLPFLCHRVDFADRGAQGTISADRAPELLRQFTEEILRGEVSARLGDLVFQYVGKGKMLKQRDDIGEGLVERMHIRIRGL
jgi:hypothetical protein